MRYVWYGFLSGLAIIFIFACLIALFLEVYT